MPRLRLVAVCFIVFALTRAAQALIIEGDQSQSTTAPADDFGFANIAYVYDSTDGIPASGVYLGNGWMISAYHVVRDPAADGGYSFGTVILDGVAYSVNPSSGVRLLNTNQTPADLTLFQLTTVPVGVGSLTISGSDPAVGTAVDMSGNGYERALTETHWNVNNSTNPPTWTETAGPGTAQGYKWVFSQTIRWGSNQVASYSSAVSDGYGTTNMLLTNFASGISGEAQAAGGDSGGGIFYKSGGAWKLGGVMIETDAFAGQPANTSVYGTNTYAADLSSYRAQIQSVVPEPRSGLLAAGGAIGMLARRRRAEYSPG